MSYTLLLIWAVAATLWALVATVLHYHNPLPVPDKGHRLYGVKDERARAAVVKMLSEVSHLKEQFTFDSGPTHQTLMRDGLTIVSHIDAEFGKSFGVGGTGLSVPSRDPQRAADEAVRLLREAGYEAERLDDIDPDLPAGYLVPIKSNAFDGWVLVFRRPLLKMPFPKKRRKAA